MGTILELRLWRTHWPPPVGPGQEAQIIIFPGVRVERQEPQAAGSATLPSRDDQASKISKP